MERVKKEVQSLLPKTVCQGDRSERGRCLELRWGGRQQCEQILGKQVDPEP